MKLPRKIITSGLLLTVGFCTVEAADAFYVGTWKIVSAAPAPWATGERKPALAESKSLTGKIVKIESKQIVGPRQVACPNPNYQVRNYGADMLFQGTFGEMKARDKSVDLGKAAASAGFR